MLKVLRQEFAEAIHFRVGPRVRVEPLEPVRRRASQRRPDHVLRRESTRRGPAPISAPADVDLSAPPAPRENPLSLRELGGAVMVRARRPAERTGREPPRRPLELPACGGQARDPRLDAPDQRLIFGVRPAPACEEPAVAVQRAFVLTAAFVDLRTAE